MRSAGTTVLFTEDDGTVGEGHIVDDYLVVVDGSAYVDSARVERAADGTFTHHLTIRGCSPGLVPTTEENS